MFEISIGDLLSSFSGDSQELEFKGDILPGFYEDLEFIGPLYLKMKLITLDDGIMALFEKIEADVIYDGIPKNISLDMIEREFKENVDPANPDDIKYINMKNMSIDLKDVIYEEILIQCID
ncbi:MAG: hypothetical protein PHS92_01230 [Candidatus Gracilibacteria bacterium]|nr:hypothetical protein [Candidatus Gracilibacteria bacterium]